MSSPDVTTDYCSSIQLNNINKDSLSDVEIESCELDTQNATKSPKKRNYMMCSPEIRCSPSPCIFEWDREVKGDFGGKYDFGY